MFQITAEDKKSEKLIAELKNYNIYDLVAKIASLNIIPQNQNKSAILDTVLNLLLSQNPKDFNSENIIGSNKLKNLINAWIDIDVTSIIDPIESPFIQRIKIITDLYNCKRVLSNITKQITKLCTLWGLITRTEQ